MLRNTDVIPSGWSGSTHLDPVIKSYSDLAFRTKTLLGNEQFPLELTDVEMAVIIDKACEVYQLWEGSAKEEYLTFCADSYIRGCGVKLDELVQVACNKQYCNETVVVETITSTNITYDAIETKTAYLSVSPFVYPYDVEYKTRFDTIIPSFTGLSGQFWHIYFDPKNPWKANQICGADCLTINPVSSQWFQLSTNVNLSASIFDFENDETLSTILSSISSYISEPFDAVPLSAMGNTLSAIPISYFPLSAFYPPNQYISPPINICLDIGKGSGLIMPTCDYTSINYCSALSSQFTISDSWNYILTSIPITSVTIAQSSTTFGDISSYFTLYCNDCDCNCQFLSSFNETLSTYSFYVNNPILSGSDGTTYQLSSLDFSRATHVELNEIPLCTNDGSFPLDYNDGIKSTFTICNTAFSTSGPFPLENTRFLYDYKPPQEVLDGYCGINNNGFTVSYYNSAYDTCWRSTPRKVKVDVSFLRQNIETTIGTISTTYIANNDYGFGKTRKVLGVFSVDPPTTGGYFSGGSDLLYNFDYALLASTFGFDLAGNRTATGKQGYDLTTYFLSKSFVETSRKMLRYTSYQYDPMTQYLRVTPEPGASSGVGSAVGDYTECCGKSSSKQCYIIGVYLSPSIEEMLSSQWVQDYVMAQTMLLLGRKRGKYANVTLYGGVTITGSELIQEANEKITKLLEELREKNYYSMPALPVWG